MIGNTTFPNVVSSSSAVGVGGPLLGERPTPLQFLEVTRVPVLARLLAFVDLPSVVHRRHPLCLLRCQEQQPLRAASDQVSSIVYFEYSPWKGNVLHQFGKANMTISQY